MTNFITCYNTQMGIQNKSADFSVVARELNINISKEYKANSMADKSSYFRANQEVFDVVKSLYNAQSKTICITEDHSLVSGIFKNLPDNSGLVYIDAHLDIHSWRSSISKRPHGMSLGTLMGLDGDELKGNIKPENLIMIGAKNFEPEEYDNLITLGVENVFYYQDGSLYNLFTQEKQELADIVRLIKEVSFRTNAMGVSFDLDALDKKEFVGAYYKVGNLPFTVCKYLLKALQPLCSLIEITELDTNFVSDNTLSILKESLDILDTSRAQADIFDFAI